MAWAIIEIMKRFSPNSKFDQFVCIANKFDAENFLTSLGFLTKEQKRRDHQFYNLSALI